MLLMKFEWNPRYTTIFLYALMFVVCCVACVFLFVRFDAVAEMVSKIITVSKPLIYAIAIAYILWPILRKFETRVYNRLEKDRPRRKLVRTLSLISTYIIFLLAVSLFFSMVIPQITESIFTLKDKMGGYVSAVQSWINHLIDDDSIFGSIFSSEFFSEQIGKLSDLLTRLFGWIYSNSDKIIGYVTNFASSFATELKNILFGIVFAIYFLLFKENLLAQIKKFFSALLPENVYHTALHYVKITDRTFGGFISGKLLDSLIIGILCFLLMTIFRMPFAPLISLIVGITNVIPFFGPFIGAIPSAIIIFIANPSTTIWFILLILALQQLDGHLIGPKILGDFVGLNPLWIIVSITIMGSLFGVFGMFFGVPTFAVFYMIVKDLTERRLKRKGMAEETCAYYVDHTYQEIVETQKKELPKKTLLQRLRERIRKK